MSQSVEKAINSDEIDLFELFKNIWQQKVFILLITVCFSLAGAGYAFLSTPTYESMVYLLPPTDKSIIELRKLNLLKQNTSNESGDNGGNNFQYSSEIVFQKFLVVLQSNAAKQAFFNRETVKPHFMALANNELTAWKEFNKAISITLSKPKSPSTANVKFQANNPDLSALWANDYADSAIELTRNQLVADLQEEIKSRLSQVDLQIQNRHQLHLSELNIELTKLREALTVAQTLNLNNPLQTDAIINQQQDMMVDEIRKLYRLGANALTAEITVISARLDNKDFIPGLTKLNQQRGLLAGMEVNAESINPAQIDLLALPGQEIKPKKALIIVLATMLGIIAAVITALIRMAIRNRRLTF